MWSRTSAISVAPSSGNRMSASTAGPALLSPTRSNLWEGDICEQLVPAWASNNDAFGAPPGPLKVMPLGGTPARMAKSRTICPSLASSKQRTTLPPVISMQSWKQALQARGVAALAAVENPHLAPCGTATDPEFFLPGRFVRFRPRPWPPQPQRSQRKPASLRAFRAPLAPRTRSGFAKRGGRVAQPPSARLRLWSGATLQTRKQLQCSPEKKGASST